MTMNHQSSFRLVLAVENSGRFHESVGARHLIWVSRTGGRWLVKLLESFGSVFFTQFCKVSGLNGFLLCLLLLLQLPFTFFRCFHLLKSRSFLGLGVDLADFIGRLFKRDFDANCLYAFPGECSGQRSDEYAKGNFEGVFHG